MLKSAYLKIEDDSSLTLEGCKFITGCLTDVVVKYTEVNFCVVENFERYDLRF